MSKDSEFAPQGITGRKKGIQRGCYRENSRQQIGFASAQGFSSLGVDDLPMSKSPRGDCQNIDSQIKTLAQTYRTRISGDEPQESSPFSRSLLLGRYGI